IYAGGMSKVRLALAILPAILLIGAFQFLIEDQARPVALQELRLWGVADYDPNENAGPTWLHRGADILRVDAIDTRQAELRGLTIVRRDQDGSLIARIDAARAVVGPDSWTLYDVTRSEITTARTERLEQLSWAGMLGPEDLDLLSTIPAEM